MRTHCVTSPLNFSLNRKGKEMEKIKQFVEDHKKEIIVVSAGIIIYSLGFKKGFNSAKEGMNYIFDQAAKTLEVNKF